MQSPDSSPQAAPEPRGFELPTLGPPPVWRPDSMPEWMTPLEAASCTSPTTELRGAYSEVYPGMPPFPDWPEGSPFAEMPFAEPWMTPLEAGLFRSPAAELPIGAPSFQDLSHLMPSLPPMP